MSDSDASERESVGWPGVSDASDAFQAGEDDAKRHAAEAPRGGRTPTKKGDSRMRVRAVARASEERAEGRGALLDSTSPPLPSDPPDHDPHAGEDSPEPFECAIAREVQHAVWPVLAAARGTGLLLVRLSLSTLREDTVLADGARFVAEVGQRPGEGVLLVRDVGPAHGRAHFYGLALTRDPAQLCERWCALTGASPRNVQRIAISGWSKEGYTAFGNLGSVLGYAFKPWPDGFGRRCLTRDVLAAGEMSAPWMAARAILLGSLPSLATEPGKASAKGRKCQRCGRDMPARKPARAVWCSKTCKSRNWEDRHPGRHRGGPTTPGNPPEEGSE